MVSVNKIERGVAKYVDTEIMPHLDANGVEKVVIGTAVSLLIRRSGAIIGEYKNNKLVKMLGVIDNDGNIDIDMLSEELKKNVSKEGIKVDVPIIGTMTFHKSDIDKLYGYITE